MATRIAVQMENKVPTSAPIALLNSDLVHGEQVGTSIASECVGRNPMRLRDGQVLFGSGPNEADRHLVSLEGRDFEPECQGVICKAFGDENMTGGFKNET